MSVVEGYSVVMASDVQRDGMYLELWDDATEKLALDAFYSDADGSMTFTRWSEDVPVEVRLWFEQQAKIRLPPS